jgi:hypothetical protein
MLWQKAQITTDRVQQLTVMAAMVVVEAAEAVDPQLPVMAEQTAEMVEKAEILLV